MLSVGGSKKSLFSSYTTIKSSQLSIRAFTMQATFIAHSDLSVVTITYSHVEFYMLIVIENTNFRLFWNNLLEKHSHKKHVIQLI
ncbi:hypothetical protein TMU01_13410 [Tenuibacillus multivorans]|nr:hypothetical protein TMU01_13410 [Tenuibacillus multivorans]